MDAKFSIPFIVGLAMARQGLTLGDFSPTSLSDPDVLAQTDKVTFVYDSSLDLESSLIIPPGIVEAVTTSGSVIVKRVEVPYGNPRRPMSSERLREKFAECARHAATPIPAESVEELIECLEDCRERASAVVANEVFNVL